MITVHAIDVSGSMSSHQLAKAKDEMVKKFQPGDVVVIFDYDFQIVTDIERPLKDYFMPKFGGGGTDADKVLAYAKTLNAKAVLYSDGYLIPEQLKQFDEFVEISYE